LTQIPNKALAWWSCSRTSRHLLTTKATVVALVVRSVDRSFSKDRALTEASRRMRAKHNRHDAAAVRRSLDGSKLRVSILLNPKLTSTSIEDRPRYAAASGRASHAVTRSIHSLPRNDVLRTSLPALQLRSHGSLWLPRRCSLAACSVGVERSSLLRPKAFLRLRCTRAAHQHSRAVCWRSSAHRVPQAHMWASPAHVRSTAAHVPSSPPALLEATPCKCASAHRSTVSEQGREPRVLGHRPSPRGDSISPASCTVRTCSHMYVQHDCGTPVYRSSCAVRTHVQHDCGTGAVYRSSCCAYTRTARLRDGSRGSRLGGMTRHSVYASCRVLYAPYVQHAAAGGAVLA